ncbi:hypothetical protein ACWDHW_29080 [Streptomyces melanosporofaciens]|uniref:hypothetical protein n=1 Tax=unclassified Streptomyces TaxID=2593676 RepID=UPI0036BFF85B
MLLVPLDVTARASSTALRGELPGITLAEDGSFTDTLQDASHGPRSSPFSCKIWPPWTTTRSSGSANHFALRSAEHGHHVFIVGGMGITPVIALAARRPAVGPPGNCTTTAVARR